VNARSCLFIHSLRSQNTMHAEGGHNLQKCVTGHDMTRQKPMPLASHTQWDKYRSMHAKPTPPIMLMGIQGAWLPAVNTYSVWKKRKVFLALLGVFWLLLPLLLMRPAPLGVLPAVGVLAGASCMLPLAPRGVAGGAMPPAPVAASCHGLGRAAACCLAALPAGTLAAAILPPACCGCDACGLSFRLPAADVLRVGALNWLALAVLLLGAAVLEGLAAAGAS
jgi:hypothetical protein